MNTNKTKLVLSINESIISLNSYNSNKWYEYDSESDTFQRHSKKTLLNICQIGTTKNVNYNSDFLGAYELHVSPKFVYTALETVYQRCATEQQENKLRKLMFETLDIMHNGIENNVDFVEYVENKHKFETMQKQVWHKFKLTEIDGVKHRIEIMPYSELQSTSKAVELNKQETVNDVDANDLCQTACCAISELFSFGLIKSTFDVWNYKDYIYKKINSVIISNKKNDNRTTSYEQLTRVYLDKENKDLLLYGRNANVFFNRIEKQSIINSLKEYLITKIDKRSNKENVMFTFENVFINGMTTIECAEHLNVARTTVNNYVFSINRLLASPEINEMLHKLIIGIV